MAQPARAGAGGARLRSLALASLGIVVGDIGTSPLYTLKTVLTLAGGRPAPEVVLGLLSLILWTLVIVTTVKYVLVAMSIDNDGEGGILALLSLLGLKRAHRPLIVAFGLFGAALIYGDGAITPAISVLSALEGLDVAVPQLRTLVLPAAAAVLVLLFAVQPLGTSRIGRAFGPVMLVWFVSLAALGLWGVAHHPGVLAAVDPRHALGYLGAHGRESFVVLGGVFLCVTGAEALYADMGHFGRAPIRAAWLALAFPSLIINYAGQAALVLDGAPLGDNIFYRLCPAPLVLPLIVLATLATVIASQAVITGAFSMTRQAIQLGWLPRLAIRQTSEEGYGQIYIGAVNWLLAVATIGLTLAFRRSDNLASAYGIAVSLTMLMTSVLLFMGLREVLGWSLVASGILAGLFLAVDAAFVGANLIKVMEGGYVPLLLASLVYGVMLIWHRGVLAIGRVAHDSAVPIAAFLDELRERSIPRVPGTAVFITRTQRDTPPVMRWHVRMNRALHERVLILTVLVERVPWVRPERCLHVDTLAPNLWRATARFGFMQRPNVPAVLRMVATHGCAVQLEDLTYYVGRESIIARERSGALHRLEVALYALMARNAAHVSDFLYLPSDCVVEIGRQVAI